MCAVIRFGYIQIPFWYTLLTLLFWVLYTFRFWCVYTLYTLLFWCCTLFRFWFVYQIPFWYLFCFGFCTFWVLLCVAHTSVLGVTLHFLVRERCTCYTRPVSVA